jgi:hypothetical protein
MTFKQSTFDNSPVLREFAKTAQAKGLIKEDPLKKLASKVVEKKIDLKPTANLTDNVLKLCAGLRSEGLDSYAAELETNLLSYKRAQTLYDAHNGETGDDLVDEAHPNGSHKMEGIDSDEAVFETIIDNQLKALKTIEKKPSGKLSSAQIIQGVKISLGQANEQELSLQVLEKVQLAEKIVNDIINKVESEITDIGYVEALKEGIAGFIRMKTWTIDHLKNFKSWISMMEWRVKPGVVFGITEDTWGAIKEEFPQAKGFIDEAIALRTSIVSMKANNAKSIVGDTKPAISADPVATKLFQAYQDLSGALATAKAKAQPLETIHPGLQQWFDARQKELSGLLEAYKNTPDTKTAQQGLDRIDAIKVLLENGKSKLGF